MSIAVILNGLIGCLEIWANWYSFHSMGLQAFEMYTIDSNLIAMFFSFAYVICHILKKKIPTWISYGKYLAVLHLTVTFLIVITVLGPTMGGYKRMLLDGNMWVHHFTAPLVLLISYLFLEKDIQQKESFKKEILIPTCIYAIVLILLNLLCVVEGPYPFLHVYEQPWWMSVLWCILILGGSYLLSCLIYKLKKN